VFAVKNVEKVEDFGLNWGLDGVHAAAPVSHA
jgi:hypothetical protein